MGTRRRRYHVDIGDTGLVAMAGVRTLGYRFVHRHQPDHHRMGRDNACLFLATTFQTSDCLGGLSVNGSKSLLNPHACAALLVDPSVDWTPDKPTAL
jgi:hypothetical protein